MIEKPKICPLMTARIKLEKDTVWAYCQRENCALWDNENKRCGLRKKLIEL